MHVTWIDPVHIRSASAVFCGSIGVTSPLSAVNVNGFAFAPKEGVSTLVAGGTRREVLIHLHACDGVWVVLLRKEASGHFDRVLAYVA